MARQDFAEEYAKKAFQELLGRDPTAAELAQAVPVFMGSDPNIHNVAGGRALVGEMALAEQNNPEKLAEKRRGELQGKAKEFGGQVGSLFQSTLGRAPSAAEQEHFGMLMAEGSLDQYTLGQFLQQLPENVRKQDEEFRKQASTELQAGDQRYLQENVLPSIQSDFARRGRSVDSSGYASAIAQAATQQNRQREAFLSNLSAQQYAGRQGAAREDYQTAQNRYFQGQDYNQARGDFLSDRATNRAYELQNYDIQRKAYEDYLRKYGKRGGTGNIISGGMQGGASGAMAGAKFGPWGALIGGAAGFGMGAYGGSRS